MACREFLYLDRDRIFKPKIHILNLNFEKFYENFGKIEILQTNRFLKCEKTNSAENTENLLRASTVVGVAQIRLTALAMLINLLAIPADTLIAAVGVTTLELAADLVIVRALVKVIARLLVLGELQAVGTRARV